MLHSKTFNNEIYCLLEKTLRILYSYFKITFDELLEKGGSFSIHHGSIETLATEIFKFLNELFPSIMNKVVQVKPSGPYTQRDKTKR